MTESLMFSMVEIHLDVAIATFVVSRFVRKQPRQYLETVKAVMQYLKATYTLGITYRTDRGDLIIKWFSDFDWVRDHISRKSTSEFIFMPNRGSVS